jgi:hypothetical protein
MTDFLLMVGGALFAMFVSGIINYKKSVWIGLTDDEMMDAIYVDDTPMERGRRVEAKLKEKNNG